MRHSTIFLIFSTAIATQVPETDKGSTPTASICPFATPVALIPSEQHAFNPLAAIVARQATTVTGACPNGFLGCSNLGAPQACCSNTAICTTDQQNHVACCASGASCTGVIGGGTATSGNTATTTQGNNGGTVVSTNGIIVTAGPPVNGIGKREVESGWMLSFLVGLFGLVV